MFSRDLDGEFVLINAGGDYESTRSSVYHEYTHFLFDSRNYYIPTWLNEAIAELFSTIELTKKEAKIGLAEPYNLSALAHAKLIPLERLFQITNGSPEYNSSKHRRGVFYAQSWGLLHYLMFGKSDIPPGAYKNLVDQVIKRPYLTEETFQDIIGLSFSETEKRLQKYFVSGRYTYRKFPFKATTENEWEMRRASESEVDLIYGILTLKMRPPKNAYHFLDRANGSPERSPLAAAYFGYYMHRQQLWSRAKTKLKDAIDLEPNWGAPYLYYADSVLRIENPDKRNYSNRLDKESTIELLTALFKARELGESRPLLYQNIGEVWTISTLRPKTEHIAVLLEGLKQYPTDHITGFYAAALYIKIGAFEIAEKIVDNFLVSEISGSSKVKFKNLAKRSEAERSK